MKNNFFKPAKDGTVLHLTKSGKWEKCTIPVGCTRHVDPSTLKKAAPAQEPPEWSREAWENRNTELSLDDYNGYEPPEYDPMDNMKLNDPEETVVRAYVKKRVNYHYSCPTCRMPFEPVPTVEAMDKQVDIHDCENLTRVEAHKIRKLVKEESGVLNYMDAVAFKPEHSECKSYQTCCKECAEKHELQLYGMFTGEELSSIVREDSMFYRPNREQFHMVHDVNGVSLRFLSSEVRDVIGDFPASQQWEYLPEKSERQVALERNGVNYGNHITDDSLCRVCGQQVYDMYCMDCWVPSGYLLEK